MTEITALALTYGLVWTILLVYVTRLRRRLQHLEPTRHSVRSNSSTNPSIR